MDPFVPNSTATAFGVQNDNEVDSDKDTGSSEGNCDTFVDVRQSHSIILTAKVWYSYVEFRTYGSSVIAVV